MPAGPFLVKINHHEAEEWLGEAVAGFHDAARASEALVKAGAANAMITLGANGAALRFEGSLYSLVPPAVQAVNSVGSGDALLAGVAAGLRRGLPPSRMATLGIAAGAANALHGGGRCLAHEVARLQKSVQCTEEAEPERRFSR